MSAPSDLKKIALELLERWTNDRNRLGRLVGEEGETAAELADYKARIEACEPEAGT